MRHVSWNPKQPNMIGINLEQKGKEILLSIPEYVVVYAREDTTISLGISLSDVKGLRIKLNPEAIGTKQLTLQNVSKLQAGACITITIRNKSRCIYPLIRGTKLCILEDRYGKTIDFTF